MIVRTDPRPDTPVCLFNDAGASSLSQAHAKAEAQPLAARPPSVARADDSIVDRLPLGAQITLVKALARLQAPKTRTRPARSREQIQLCAARLGLATVLFSRLAYPWSQGWPPEAPEALAGACLFAAKMARGPVKDPLPLFYAALQVGQQSSGKKSAEEQHKSAYVSSKGKCNPLGIGKLMSCTEKTFNRVLAAQPEVNTADVERAKNDLLALVGDYDGYSNFSSRLTKLQARTKTPCTKSTEITFDDALETDLFAHQISVFISHKL